MNRYQRALKNFIMDEKKGIAEYSDAYEHTGNKLFKRLARDEKHHHDALVKLYKSLEYDYTRKWLTIQEHGDKK